MAVNPKPLRILSLDVENILRIEAVFIKPNGRMVELTGRNRQGKSSVIDAIWMALGGEKMIPADPIHDGAEMGKIVVEIGDDDGTKYVVTRKIRAKEGGGYSLGLTIENEDGGRLQNAQTILNTLIGSLSYDPLKFIAMQAKDQFDLLKKFVTGADFDEIEESNKEDFDARTVVNRDAKAKRAQAAGISLDTDLACAVRADETGLVADLARAGTTNAQVDLWKMNHTAMTRRVSDLKAAANEKKTRAEVLKQQAVELEADASEDTAEATRIQRDLDSPTAIAPASVNTDELQAKIAQARSWNEKLDANSRAAAEHQRITAEAKDLEAKSEALTKAIDVRNAAKAEAISKAEMPVPGIDFGDGELYFEGHPLSAASQAQKLQIAIAIAAALQPRLRFITTKSGALLDDESFAELARLAEERDLLVICETVRSERPSAVVIEDGHVKQRTAQAAE